MKTFRLLSYLFIATLCMTSFASCSDDDDKLSVDEFKDAVVGTWQVKQFKGWEIYDGEKESWDDKIDYVWTFTLSTNGTGTEIDIEDGYEYVDDFKWTLNETTLTFTYSEYDIRKSTIKKMTKNSIELFSSSSNQEVTIILEKIK